jgi:hypothetical protein
MAADTSAKYPSKTGLCVGDRFDHERYGECTVRRVRRARNNKGILPYDSVTVTYGPGSPQPGSITLPMFDRPTGLRRVNMTEEVSMPDPTDSFLAERAAWKAAGCPADHPYMVKARAALAAPRAAFVEPLVPGITTEMVEAAVAMRPLMPERPHWPEAS